MLRVRLFILARGVWLILWALTASPLFNLKTSARMSGGCLFREGVEVTVRECEFILAEELIFHVFGFRNACFGRRNMMIKGKLLRVGRFEFMEENH